MMFEDPITMQDYRNQADAINNTHDTREALHKIKQPSLIMVGTADQLIPKEESEFLNEKIPNSRMEIFEGLGHGFIIEQPEKVNNLMWSFIQEHLG